MEKDHKYFNRLTELKDNFPELTFNNNGYEYLSPKVKEDHKEQIIEIESILRKTIKGFDRFDNFKPKRELDGRTYVRVQYAYDSSFIGVGYFNLDLWKDEEWCNDNK